MVWVYLVLLPIGIALTLIGAIWRYGARLRAMPCPTWLIPLLENPYMQSVAGSSLLLERAKVENGMDLLDVGCGPGRLAIPAARMVGSYGSVTALDIQAGMLNRLERRIKEHRLDNIRLIHAGAVDGALSENSYDRALMVTVLGEIRIVLEHCAKSIWL